MRSTVCIILLGFIFCSTCAPINNTIGLCGKSKIKVTETILDSERVDDYQVLYVSSDNQIVFIRTTDGNVYRSADEGKTWTKQTVPDIMKNIDTVSGISRIIDWESSDKKKITLYFLSIEMSQGIWVSTNKGETYNYVDNAPSGINNIYPHPLYEGLALAKRKVTDGEEVWKCSQSGESWTKLVGPIPFVLIAWSTFPAIDPNRIYLLEYETESRTIGKIVYSDNFFNSSTTAPLQYVSSWKLFPPNNFVAITCVSPVCESKELQISDDGGKTFYTSSIPETRQETPDEQNFYIWEFSEDAIWTYVERECFSGECWGDIFHSTNAKKNFTLALQFNKKWEFTKFNGLDGIYVANQFLAQGGVPKEEDRVRSLITYNRGSSWNVLEAPEYDSKGQPTCKSMGEECSLHIHGYGNTFTYFYSIPKAPGLMIASGNLGTRLENREDETNTFASFDGGVSWKEVTKGTFVPEIGDMGGVIVMVKETGDTNQILYTVSDGDEWLLCNFTEKLLDVTNIRVSRAWDARSFVLYGQRLISGVFKAVLVHLDFNDEFTGQCTSSDFETWSPTDKNSNCVMGAKTSYKKRIQGKKCYLGTDYDQAPTSQPCPCKANDYECDHCFYRPSLSSPCYLECDVPNLPPKPSYCSVNITDYYETDLGYRLVDNNKCDVKLQGSEKPKARIECTYFPPNPLTPGTGVDKMSYDSLVIVIVVVVLLVGASFSLWYLYNNNESFHNFVSYTLGISQHNVVQHYEEQGQSLTSTVDVDLEE